MRSKLRVAVLGDFCLARYLEIHPAKQETSIETGLPVHNVVKVRAQPGGAGTILNNLSTLGIGNLYPIGFAGQDGEGFELCRALTDMRGVHLDHLLQTADRRTFTYCKPLVMATGHPPCELSRLDSKNCTPTPPAVESRLIESVTRLTREVTAVILLSLVDVPETGGDTLFADMCGAYQALSPVLRAWLDTLVGHNVSGMVHGAILVVRAGVTPFPVVEAAVAALGRDRILGILLNAVDPSDIHGRGYYRHYYGIVCPA